MAELCDNLVTHFGQLGIDSGGISFGNLGGVSLCLGLFLVVPFLSVGDSFSFKSSNDITVLPADFVAESSQRSDFSAWKRSDFFQGGGDLEFFLGIEWWWASIEALESLVGGLTSSGFIWEHTSDHSFDHHGWGSVVEWTVFWVGGGSMMHLFKHDQLVSVVVTSDEDSFASDENDIVTSEEFLGDSGAKSTSEVVLRVNNDVLFKSFSHCRKNICKF